MAENLDPTIGAEIRKTRPAVIVSEDAIGTQPLRAIVPLTDWKKHDDVAPWLIGITPDANNGLSKASAADSFQIRSVSQVRFVRCLGKITSDQMKQILEAIEIVIGAA